MPGMRGQELTVELVLTEDQDLLAKTANDFVRQHAPISRTRAQRDSGDPTGFSKALWQQMAELGWTGDEALG